MNAATFWLFIIKLIAPSLTLLIINKFKKNKNMRYIDGLQLPCKESFLKLSIAYAKAEIIELGLPPTTDVKELALDYCHQFGCILGDLGPYNPMMIDAWVGPRPVKVPR